VDTFSPGGKRVTAVLPDRPHRVEGHVEVGPHRRAGEPGDGVLPAPTRPARTATSALIDGLLSGVTVAARKHRRGSARRPKPHPMGCAQTEAGGQEFQLGRPVSGREVFVFTASDGTTVGLTQLGPKRRPKPGKLALLDEQNDGIKVLWYFLKLASSDALTAGAGRARGGRTMPRCLGSGPRSRVLSWGNSRPSSGS